jgi:hypothetical protein
MKTVVNQYTVIYVTARSQKRVRISRKKQQL